MFSRICPPRYISAASSPIGHQKYQLEKYSWKHHASPWSGNLSRNVSTITWLYFGKPSFWLFSLKLNVYLGSLFLVNGTISHRITSDVANRKKTRVFAYGIWSVQRCRNVARICVSKRIVLKKLCRDELRKRKRLQGDLKMSSKLYEWIHFKNTFFRAGLVSRDSKIEWI